MYNILISIKYNLNYSAIKNHENITYMQLKIWINKTINIFTMPFISYRCIAL